MATEEPPVTRIRRIAAGFQESKVLLLAVDLGVFDHLARGAATAAEVATALAITPRGAEILLDALTAMALVEKGADGRYANLPEVAAVVTTGGAHSMAHILRHNHHMFGTWARLEDTVRHGPTRREEDRSILADPEANRAFILGMAETSRPRVGPVVARLSLAGARRLVDLGGGPAHYACEAVSRHPGLTAALVDLPLTVAVAREYIAARGLSDRVEARVCDFYAAEALDLGGPADVVLVSQVLHAEGPDENAALLAKIAPHVVPGGWVVVVENMAGPDRTTPQAAALFAVNMLAGTPRGRTYTEAEIAAWLRAAGLEPQPAEEVTARTWLIRAQKPPAAAA